MHRYFSFCLYWLLVIVTFTATVNIPVFHSPEARAVDRGHLAISSPHTPDSSGLFTKPSSVAQEYLLKEEYRTKQVNLLARLMPLAVLAQQQRHRQQQHKVPPLSPLLFLPRKVAPASSTDVPFLS